MRSYRYQQSSKKQRTVIIRMLTDKIESSANKIWFDISDMISRILLIRNRTNMGPSMEPCGTSCATVSHSKEYFIES
jgi:hypothetical protein